MPSSLGYQLLIQSATVSGNRNAEEAWDFATQWSWPPEESIDFVAPGYMGWRSHELQGPYWGRMGRSPNWDSTGQGFRNFKLENQYLGAVPMVFALSSCWLLLWQRRKLGTSGHEVLFWAIVSVLSLVLSFGKHFYLYQLFYSLPLVSEIRNPNKFLQVFQLATGILSAYGLHFACRTAWIGKDRTAAVLPWRKFLFFLIGVGSASAALAVGAYQSRVRASEIVADLKATGWDAGAETIVHNRISALTHGAWMTFAALILLYLLRGNLRLFRLQANRWLPWIVVLAVLLDVLGLGPHYVKTMSSAALDKQVIVDLLRSDPHDRRIAVTTQDGFYNEWLTYLFPYHQVEAFNPTQWPRLPTDYRKFLAALRGQDVRLWELAAVGHVMAPTKTWNQISRSAWSTSFEKVYDYDVVLDETERVRVVPPVVDQTGQHCILRLKSAAPKYVLVHDWEIVSNETALRRLQDPSFVPLTKVWISEDTVSELPEPAMSGITPITSAVRESLREVKIRATTERPAILRISERYLPEWSVHIDGVPANLLRCDFLMQGVYLKPGTHVVSLSYQSNIGYRWMQWLVLVLCVAGASTILMRKYRIILGGKPPGGTGTAAKHS